MIEAIIHYHDSTLIVDLPRSIYDIHEKLMSIGCPTALGRIPLTDNEDDALRVKLYGRIEMGNHLIRIYPVPGCYLYCSCDGQRL